MRGTVKHSLVDRLFRGEGAEGSNPFSCPFPLLATHDGKALLPFPVGSK